jgi:hypothetical protein
MLDEIIYVSGVILEVFYRGKKQKNIESRLYVLKEFGFLYNVLEINYDKEQNKIIFKV